MNNDIVYKYEPLWGEWKVEKLIGEGSIGKVYKISRDLYGKKHYSAVKVIKIPTKEQYESYIDSIEKNLNYDDKEFFEEIVKDIINEINFLYELKAHSNIIGYEDHMIKEEKDSWHIFIRMEYADNLKVYLKNKLLDNRDILRLGIDISNALILCHKKNILHRDIKEENIFISKTDNIFKLGDFSVSKELGKDTLAKTKVGTMNYMPPEIIKGEDYNKNVDIYCLGIVLYKLFNKGRLPYLPEFPKKINITDLEKAYLARVSNDYMKAPSEANEKIAKVILKACTYDKHKRYQTAEDLKKDLEICYENLENNNSKNILESDFVDNCVENNTETLNKTVDIFSSSLNNVEDNIVKKNTSFKTKLLVSSMLAVIFILSSLLIINSNIFGSDKKIKSSFTNNNETENDDKNSIKPLTSPTSTKKIEKTTKSTTPDATIVPTNESKATEIIKTQEVKTEEPQQNSIKTTGVNLLANSGAEKSDIVWESRSDLIEGNSKGVMEITGTTSYSGNKCFKVTKTNLEGANYFIQNVSIKKDATYLYSFYCKTDNIKTDQYGAIGAIGGELEENYKSKLNKTIGTNNWTYKYIVFELIENAGSNKIDAYLGVREATGTAYFDEVKLEEIVVE
ncbi:MAG: serine/threonine-protein kinase [Clostridiales bacterium]